MKTKISYLAVGIALGYLANDLRHEKSRPIEISINRGRSTATFRAVSLPSPRDRQFKDYQISAATPPAQVQRKPPTPESPEILKESERTYGLIMSEENIAEMERQKEQLSRYAYATQTNEGWRIQLLPEDKIFLKSGLSSGDLITFESMDRQLQTPERAQLASRMVAILNRIQR